jgi:hypothetical protein
MIKPRNTYDCHERCIIDSDIPDTYGIIMFTACNNPEVHKEKGQRVTERNRRIELRGEREEYKGSFKIYIQGQIELLELRARKTDVYP